LSGPIAIPKIEDPSAITRVYERLVGNWATAVQGVTAGLFSILALIDFGVYMAKLAIQKHTWDSAMLAMTNKLMSVGFFLTLFLNGTTWLPQIINLFITIGRSGSGLKSLGPSEIFGTGIDLSGTLLWDVAKSAAHADMLSAFGIMLAIVAVMLAFGLLTLHFLIAQIEIYYAIAVGTIFLSLGGSKWTVSYVERYFSFCVQAGIKMMVMYFAVGGASSVIGYWKDEVKTLDGALSAIMGGFIIAAGAFLLAAATWHVSKITAAILGGSPHMSGSDLKDFVMPIAAAVTSMAAVVATGGVGAAGAGAGALAGSAARAGMGAAGSLGGGVATVPSPMLQAANMAARGIGIAAHTVRSMPNGSGHAISPPPSGIHH
jgi:type IV secretion system protein TrbL